MGRPTKVVKVAGYQTLCRGPNHRREVNDMANKTILLVDDNKNDVFLAQRALKKSNLNNNVVVASNGEEALDYLYCRGKYADRDQNCDVPLVTLLDLKMPKMDGLETLKQIRDNPKTKNLPVVMLTSSEEDTDIIRSYNLGCNAYVRKPVDFDQFAEAIKQMGFFWLVLNEAPI
jgi:two-component system response regulator